jgi:hypothetical protein
MLFLHILARVRRDVTCNSKRIISQSKWLQRHPSNAGRIHWAILYSNKFHSLDSHSLGFTKKTQKTQKNREKISF